MTSITDKLGVNSWGMYFDPAKFDFETFKSHWDYDLSMMNKLPINWVRIGYTYYDGAVNADGSMNFERLDYAVESAQKYGFKVILPIWVVDDGLTNKSNIDYQTYYAKWLDMIRAIVMRYAGKGIYYEAADEAFSGGHFWLNQPISDNIVADIINMNNRFYAYTKAYDETSKFINGDFAAPSSAAYQAISLGMLDYGDYASYHPYFTDPEDMISSSGQIDFRQAIKDKGLKLSATEYGFGVPSAFNGANTREEQASKLVRQTLILDLLGFEHIIQFTMDGSDKAWVMQNDDGTFNLTGNMMQNVMFSLQGYSFSEQLDSDENDYILRYVKDGDVDKIVHWTTSNAHKFGDFYLTSMPTVETLNFGTSNTNSEILNGIVLEQLENTDVKSNYSDNMTIIRSALAEINVFLKKYGFNTVYVDYIDLSAVPSATVVFELNNQIGKTEATVESIISLFNRTPWLENIDLASPNGYYVYENSVSIAFVNTHWINIETNINNLLNAINKY